MVKSSTEIRRERRKRNDAMRNASTTRVPLYATSDYYSATPLGEAHPIRASLSDQQWTNLMAAMSSSSLPTGKARGHGPRSSIYDTGLRNSELLALVDDLFWNLHLKQDVHSEYVHALLSHPGYSATEEKQRSKFGPYMSAYTTEVADKTKAYFGPEFMPTLQVQQLVTSAIQEVARDLKDANQGAYLSPVSVDEAYKLMPKDKFYGYPHFTSKWAEDDSIVNDTIDIARKIIELDRDAIDTYHKSPWVVFNRVVPNGEEAPKVRATMAPAKYGALFEKCFTHPVLNALKLTEWGVGYQGNHVVGPIIQGWVRRYNTCFSMDYEAFDQHTMSYARNSVRDVLKSAFDDEWGSVLDVMFASFDNPGLIHAHSMLYAEEGFGLGSGIGPTGIIGTIWNRIIAVCMMKALSFEYGIDDVRHVGYGDDTLFCYDCETVVPTMWFYEYVQKFGMVINPSKQEYSQGDYRYASFLANQYYWLKDLEVTSDGVYSLYRAWARLLYKDVQIDQEDKWVRKEYEGLSPVGCDMLDTIATLENCKGNPAFPAFVELVRDGHPIRLKSSHFLPRTKLDTATGQENQGLKSFHSVRHIIQLEVLEGEAGVIDDVEWQRYCLGKFSHHVWRSKGILISAVQALNYLNGVDIEWDPQQLGEAAARGTETRSPLVDRVHDLETRKGVILDARQIEDLRCNRKIHWTDGNRVALQRFGNLSQTEKDLWRSTHLRNLTVREVIDNRSKYDFDALWHDVLPLLKQNLG